MSVLRHYPALVIPAYQPDGELLTLVRALRERRPEQLIIVVNDGSDLQIRWLFEELLNYQVQVLHHSRNMGKGQALKTGFSHYLNLMGSEALGVITADADGQHTVEDILALSDALVEAGHQLHLGVRNFAHDGIPWRSKMGNVLTGYIFRLFSATPLYDTQTGLRGIPAQLLKPLLTSRSKGYELEMEMLLMAAEHNIQLNQIPIKTLYFNRNAHSHFNPWRDSFKIYRVVARFLLRQRRKSRPSL